MLCCIIYSKNVITLICQNQRLLICCSFGFPPFARHLLHMVTVSTICPQLMVSLSGLWWITLRNIKLLNEFLIHVVYLYRLVHQRPYILPRKTVWNTTTWRRTIFAGTLKSSWSIVAACLLSTTARCICHMILKQTFVTCSCLQVSLK